MVMMKIAKATAAITLAIAIVPPAMAQADDPLLLRAYAAGYKAQFLCSGLFSAGRTQQQIERDELTGVYPEIAKILPELKARISEDAKTVSVSFSGEMPPRLAVHNRFTGCTALPIGGTVDRGPRIRGTRLSPGALDDSPWPVGDTNAAKPSIKMQAIAKNSAMFGGKTSAILIAKDGKIIAEQYMLGHNKHSSQRTWSVAKSITGSYVGFVRQQTGSDFGEGKPQKSTADPRRGISINNLLRMASGIHSDSDGARADHIYMGGGYVRAWATPFPLIRKPGSHFRYANNDTLVAMLKTRSEARKLHPHNMFDMLGMTRSFAETDGLGDYISSSQMWVTARDLARLGQLYLNGGLWPDTGPEATRLLPANWREYVSTPSGPQPTGGKFGYGATFWIVNKSPGIPKDAFAAVGNRGQYLIIIPSKNLLIIRRGYDSGAKRFDIEGFIRAVLKGI